MQQTEHAPQVRVVTRGTSAPVDDHPRPSEPLVYEIKMQTERSDTTGVWVELYTQAGRDSAAAPFVLDALSVRLLDHSLGRYSGEITVRDEMSIGVGGGDLSLSLYKEWPLSASLGTALMLGAMLMWAHVRRQAHAQRTIARHEITSREAERARLARELHDGPLQKMNQVACSLSGAKGDLLRGAAGDLRMLLLGLRPPALDRYGLGAALLDLAGVMAERTPPLVVRVRDTSTGRLGPDAELAVYRVAQQALTNAYQHGRADCAWVFVDDEPSGLRLLVRDDGSGLPETLSGEPPDPARLVRLGHLGLAGMAERAALLGGSLTLRSGPGGHGSELTLTIPSTHDR